MDCQTCYVIVGVKSLEFAIEFYRDVLGLPGGDIFYLDQAR